MPRGGGFGGGGFRGGGFGGGGFRGGGFRGGGFSRAGRITTGRPFGRTGTRRTVTHRPHGPYTHHYYRPHWRYYRRYRRWYRWWWWGSYHRPWFYSPMYLGGISTLILVLLMFQPLFGVMVLFPFSGADLDGTVNYQATETLYYSEYWYEHEFTKAGGTISYSVQSQAPITFLIWDQPFERLPTTSRSGSVDPFNFTLQSEAYEYIGFFLNSGSTLTYSFSADAPLTEFFIADGPNFNEWNYYGSPSFTVHEENIQSKSGSITISTAQDYYLVWFNEEVSPVSVSVTSVEYTATDVYDITYADVWVEAEESVSGTFQVPAGREGNWYFFIYFDPMNSPLESTKITFDVTYETGVTGQERWINFQPILIFIGLAVVILIIFAFIARRSQGTTPSTTPSSAPSVVTLCPRCGADMQPGDAYCTNCGGRREGRDLGVPSLITPPDATYCANCGDPLSKGAGYCTFCGTKVG